MKSSFPKSPRTWRPYEYFAEFLLLNSTWAPPASGVCLLGLSSVGGHRHALSFSTPPHRIWNGKIPRTSGAIQKMTNSWSPLPTSWGWRRGSSWVSQNTSKNVESKWIPSQRRFLNLNREVSMRACLSLLSPIRPPRLYRDPASLLSRPWWAIWIPRHGLMALLLSRGGLLTRIEEWARRVKVKDLTAILILGSCLTAMLSPRSTLPGPKRSLLLTSYIRVILS